MKSLQVCTKPTPRSIPPAASESHGNVFWTSPHRCESWGPLAVPGVSQRGSLPSYGLGGEKYLKGAEAIRECFLEEEALCFLLFF